MVLTRDPACLHRPSDAAGSLLNLLRQSSSFSVELEKDVLRGMPRLAVIAYAYAALDESRDRTNVVRKVSGRELSGRHKRTSK
jgi:hypothetical protein